MLIGARSASLDRTQRFFLNPKTNEFRQVKERASVTQLQIFTDCGGRIHCSGFTEGEAISMTMKSAYAGSHRAGKTNLTPPNSIVAAAATAWNLEVTYREAQAGRKNPASVQRIMRSAKFPLTPDLEL
jgi:hypothetical protein